MAQMIPDADIERVKRQTDLVALIRSRGIELKPKGKDWVGLCPFHQDRKNPNFIITPGKGLFHCMACGAAGNAIQFIERHDKVGFRHAFELLNAGGAAAFEAAPRLRSRATTPRLPNPLDVKADDGALMNRVVAYYHQRFKQMPQARAYLASRGLNHEETINFFQIGFADRTLGLRLPESNRKEGELLRARLAQLGIWRGTGREHFNGCVLVPLRDEAGKVVSFYGRRCARTMPGAPKHLYSPGPHRGFFNPRALDSEEIILCEAVIDALTFYASGFHAATCIYGTEGFTEALLEMILRKKVRRVRLAYDADEAGERAAKRDAQRLRAHGIEVYRVKFPWGMDANDYARKVTPADKSLALLLNASVWVGGGNPPKPVTVDAVESPDTCPSAPASFLAAPTDVGMSSPAERATKEKKEEAKTPVIAVPSAPMLEQRGDAWFLQLENCEYRVTGLEKTLGSDGLKIMLRLKVGDPSTPLGTGRFHLDQLDLCRDADRRRFIERAAQETGLLPDLLRRDMGRLLLAAEQAQAELGKPVEAVASQVVLTVEEREEALAWLSQPDLMERLQQAFSKSGIIGERSNALVAYLACVSRKLERPLAVIIQSASAAGKTTLMDAVLSFFPEEERVKYSAMTGQSLYYLGETNLKHKILAVVEEAGAEKASYALKLLQSEGELTIASTGKDPQSGKMVTHEYRVEGPVTIMLTTTAIDLDEELQNRCLTLSVDESTEQTQAIHRAQRERRTLSGLVVREERRGILQKLRNAQRLLQPLEIVNPYAPFLEFPAGQTRNRRDHEKYLTLIDAIALLHQRQRRHGQHQTGGRTVEYIEATLEDIALANRLAPEVLGRSLDELPPQTRSMLERIRGMAKEKPGARPFLFSRRALREASGWSLTQVRLHLERLIEHEYLAMRHGRLGSPFLYELLIDADASETTVHIRLIDIEELRNKCGYNEQPGGVEGGGGGGVGGAAPPPARPAAKAA
jgi:DNA primase catalytic core